MYDVRNLNKVLYAIQDYFECRHSSPLSLAYRLSSLPDEQQEQIFELCMAYMQELASREVFTAEMRNYKEIAKRMTSAI